jgi:hypothetical protein
MEKDDELKGEGNSYDFGARMLDSRIGRWFAMDYLTDKYPYDSPYMVSGNSPISIIDPDGERKRKITHVITMGEDGKTVQSVFTEDKIVSYELKSLSRITGFDRYSGDAEITYDYYDTADIEIIVKSASGEIIHQDIKKDNLMEKRFTDKTFTPKFILESKDKISHLGIGGYAFSDGEGNSNTEYLRKGNRNAKWLDGKGLGSVLLTLLNKDLKKPSSVSHTTKGNSFSPDDGINSIISSVDSAVSAAQEALKLKKENTEIRKVCNQCGKLLNKDEESTHETLGLGTRDSIVQKK